MECTSGFIVLVDRGVEEVLSRGLQLMFALQCFEQSVDGAKIGDCTLCQLLHQCIWRKRWLTTSRDRYSCTSNYHNLPPPAQYLKEEIQLGFLLC